MAAGLGLVPADDVDPAAVETGLEGGVEGEAHFGGGGVEGVCGGGEGALGGPKRR